MSVDCGKCGPTACCCPLIRRRMYSYMPQMHCKESGSSCRAGGERGKLQPLRCPWSTKRLALETRSCPGTSPQRAVADCSWQHHALDPIPRLTLSRRRWEGCAATSSLPQDQAPCSAESLRSCAIWPTAWFRAFSRASSFLGAACAWIDLSPSSDCQESGEEAAAHGWSCMLWADSKSSCGMQHTMASWVSASAAVQACRHSQAKARTAARLLFAEA